MKRTSTTPPLQAPARMGHPKAFLRIEGRPPAREDFFFVLADGEVAGDAEVEDAGFAGHEVDVGGAVHGREL